MLVVGSSEGKRDVNKKNMINEINLLKCLRNCLKEFFQMDSLNIKFCNLPTVQSFELL